MKNLLFYVVLFLFISCKKESGVFNEPTNKVLVLKVDYLTHAFEEGKEFSFPKNTNTFTITPEYKSPGDFGNIKLIYKELNETLFDGGIIWMGKGNISFPQNMLNAYNFNKVSTNDTINPVLGFENVFNPNKQVYNDTLVWNSVQNIVKVREYLKSNPNGKVKLFLYTPSVGDGNPADWDWIVYLKN